MKIFLNHTTNLQSWLRGLVVLLLLSCGMVSRSQDITYGGYNGAYISVSAADNFEWYSSTRIMAPCKLFVEDGASLLFYGEKLTIDPGVEIVSFSGFNPDFTHAGVKSADDGTGSIVFTTLPGQPATGVPQLLSGGYTGVATTNVLPGITIDNADGVKLSDNNTRIGNRITFTEGHLFIDAYDMVLSSTATITGADADKFVVTDVAPQSGGGHLVKESYAGAFTFPVGMDVGDYTPASVAPASANTIHVSVTNYDNDVPTQVNTDGVHRSWHIYGDNNSGATIALQHNSSTSQEQWNPDANFVTRYGTYPNHTGDKTSDVKSAWQSNTPGASSDAGGAGTETNSRTYSSLATSANASEAWYSKASSVSRPLPLKLLSFTVAKQTGSKNIALLNWKVTKQVNTQKFEIERSTDGMHFTQVGTKAAAGNYASEMSYAYTDASPAAGTNYYRLKVVDINGNFTFSAVRPVVFDEGPVTIQLAPNPTRNHVYVKGISAPVVVRVLDMRGRLLKTVNVANENTAVDLSAFAAEVYVVQVLEDGLLISTQRIVKQ